MIHVKNQNQISREALRAIEVVKPQHIRGTQWQGINHGALLDTIEEVAASDFNLEVSDERWEVRDSGANLFGSFDFRNSELFGLGMGMSLGLKHSNSAKHALTLAVGAKVFVCENGMITGEFVMARKHTVGLSFVDMIHKSLALYMNQIHEVKQWRHDLMRKNMTDNKARLVMIDAARKGVISYSKLERVDKGWREPEYPDFEPRTAWSLYNSFTETAKEYRPEQQFRTIREAGKLLMAA